jgi:hypothetical protein
MNVVFFTVIGVGVAGAAARVGLRVWPKVKGMFGASSLTSSSSSTNTGFFSEMTREEALMMLGLDEKATMESITARHRKLMIKNHPDAGGSTYISTKINEAKDLLAGKDKR